MHTTGPSPIEIKRHGHALATALFDLREAGETVAPFKGGLFRVGEGALMRTCSAAEIHGLAAAVRERRKSARHADNPRRPMARHEIERNSTKTADLRNTPAGDGIDALTPDGQRAVAGNPTKDATPCGRVDGASSAVPPVTTSQADGVAAPPATPAPTTGTGAGTVSPGDAMVCAPVPAGTSPANPGGSHDAGLTPEPEVARPATPAAVLCPCGRAKGHGGRCWHKRGLPGPVEKAATGKPFPRVYRANRVAPQTQAARITALECEVDALKSAGVRYEQAIAELRAELCMGKAR